jgi:hypothetical protein
LYNQFRVIRVFNIQQYAIGRGRYVFPPRETIEVIAKEGSQLSEIKACVYLKVRILGDYDLGSGEFTPLDGLEESDMPQRIFGGNGQNLPMRRTTRRPESDPNMTYDGGDSETSWSKSDAVQSIGTDADREALKMTVYTGLDGDVRTVYSGLDRGEREDVGEYPKTNAEVEGAAVVVPVAYEEQDIQQLVALAKTRELYVPEAATKEQIIDSLRADDSDGEESNTNRRLDQYDIQLDPDNVAETSGHVVTSEVVGDADIPTDPVTAQRDVPETPYPDLAGHEMTAAEEAQTGGMGATPSIVPPPVEGEGESLEATPDAADAAVEVDYEAMTVPELRDYAKKRNISLTGADKKADVIARIKQG